MSKLGWLTVKRPFFVTFVRDCKTAVFRRHSHVNHHLSRRADSSAGGGCGGERPFTSAVCLFFGDEEKGILGDILPMGVRERLGW